MTQGEQTASVPRKMAEAFSGRPLEEMLQEPSREGTRRNYAMGYSDTFMELLMRRSAARNAAHLMPHLEPGMTLLDLGCGPGSITVGLAEAVSPGRAWGLDMDEEQLQAARRLAENLEINNLEFNPGDALRLPFEDDSLDVVHCHGFLMHSPRIREQMREILRVLRSGGILSSRDMDVPTSFISPTAPDNRGMWEMLARVVRQEGGDPTMGSHLKAIFLNAGLTDVRAGFAADSYTSPDEVEFLAEFLTRWGLSEEFRVRTGHSEEEFQEWQRQVERWRRRHGAVGCFHFGHALGRKP